MTEPVPVGPEPQTRTILDRGRDALDARLSKDALRQVLSNVLTYAEHLQARVAELEAGNAGLDDLRIRALDKNDQLLALLALATEFRLGEPGYSLLVRLAPDGRGWAVLEAQRTSRGRRAWTESGWQHGLVAGEELFCWPSGRAAVAEARRIMPGAVVLDEPAPVEDPHDSPLHHDYRVGRDLPETGGAR